MSSVGSIVNDVLIGQQSQLFLAGGAHSILDFTSGRTTVPETSYATFVRNITQRADDARTYSVAYLHVIFPDKQSALTKYFPFDDPICLGQAYLAKAGYAADHVMYPLELLRQHQDASFLRTDTHLSDYGNIIIAAALVQRLTGLNCDSIERDMLGKLTGSRSVCGDLGSKLTPPVSAEESVLAYTWRARHFNNHIVATNSGLADVWIADNPLFDRRLLLFGDLFARALGPILSFYFRDIMFLRTPYFHVDVLSQMQPDYVVTSNVERYLTNVLDDEDRPNFFLFPYIGRETPEYLPGPGFAEAFSAMLSYKRRPYSRFMAKLRDGV